MPATAENRLDFYCRQAEQRGASDLFLHEGLPPRLRVEGALVEFPGAGPVTAADLAPLNAGAAAFPGSAERDFHYVASFGSRFRVQSHRVLGRQAAVLRIDPGDRSRWFRKVHDHRFPSRLAQRLRVPARCHHRRPRRVRLRIQNLPLLEKEWELDFALQIESVGRFRANAHYNRGNLQAAFRLIADHIASLADLGHRPIVQQLCNLREGLILVTGITGSGKSTTLAAMVEHISRLRSGVIISVEDPIEYIFQHAACIIKQREVGVDTHSFAAALRHVLRQDPDVILVSELRDLETIRTAITAAETGHLVISTLHTINAPKTLDRLIDVFPGDQQPQVIAQIANCLQAVISQRLLPRSDGSGRVLASEVMVMNHAVRACIRQRKVEQIPSLMQIGARDGMHTLDESLADLVFTGQITAEEARHHASRPDALNERMPRGAALGRARR